jgi:hypothetical protein
MNDVKSRLGLLRSKRITTWKPLNRSAGCVESTGRSERESARNQRTLASIVSSLISCDILFILGSYQFRLLSTPKAALQLVRFFDPLQEHGQVLVPAMVASYATASIILM